MVPRRPFLLLAVVSVVSFGACVDDPVLPDYEIPLTEAEAEVLGIQVFRQALVQALAASRDTAATSAPEAWRVPETLTLEDTLSVPCDLGGSIGMKLVLSITVDDEVGTESLTLSLIQTHRQCQVKEGGVTFTLVGAPNVDVTMTVSADGSGQTGLSGSMTGGLAAAVDHRAQTCTLDVHFTGTSHEDGSATLQYTGTVCGADATQTVAIPARGTS